MRSALQYEESDEEETNEESNKTNLNGNCNGGIPNGVPPHQDNTVISRDKLILVPDGSLPNGISKSSPQDDDNDDDEGNDGEEELERYTLANCLDYVKAGVESIIEDQVTSRFEAEELKNWNLLTRTNRQYEFISWKLTVIWVFGFFIRYFFLLPLRVLICFIGVS